MIHVLAHHTLARPLFSPPPSIPLSLLEQTVVTGSKRDHNITVTLSNDMEVTLDKKVFVYALDLPYHDPTQFQFDEPSTMSLCDAPLH